MMLRENIGISPEPGAMSHRAARDRPATIPATKPAAHLAALAGFAALTIAWTWPLAAHLGDALPGDPGDNYSFVWNLWWMRHVLATPGLPYFHTTYLFYPFGASIADHPHTALPALVAATVLKPVPVVAAQNLLLLAYVFLNMTCAYALAWAITRHARASVLAAVVFGLSPYIAVHLLGHFDLVAAFTLPLFALALRRALGHPRSAQSAINPQDSAFAAGLVLAATAYIAYYYVVYLLFFAIVYLVAWVNPIAVTPAASQMTQFQRRLRAACALAALALVALAAGILLTGGRSFWVFDVAVSARTPQNTLTIAWIFAVAALALTWRPTIRANREAATAWSRAFAVAWRVVAAFAPGAAPLLWPAPPP